MNKIENIVEPLSEREQLIARAKALRSISMGESMSGMAVSAFFRREFEAERLMAIVAFSDVTEVPISVMSQRNMVEHNVINSLLEQNNIQSAREVALDPQKGRNDHPELFEEAEKWMKSQRSMSGFTDF